MTILLDTHAYSALLDHALLELIRELLPEG